MSAHQNHLRFPSLFYLLGVLLLLTACSSPEVSEPQITASAVLAEVPPESSPSAPPASGLVSAPTLEIFPQGVEGAALFPERGVYFSAAGACEVCHKDMFDESGEEVSNAKAWRSTMMANAARDPYWLATVRAESLVHPQHQAVIEDKCATCHTPMARFTAVHRGQEAQLLDGGFIDSENSLHNLGFDGVSCTLCHQIQPDGFGESTSFSGGFAIDVETPEGRRALFGPYEVDDLMVTIMGTASGFLPVQGIHLSEAELCATCHTLYTPTVDQNGEIVGEFPEQTPYLEWRHSAYSGEASCQGCHMPEAQGGVVLSVTGGDPRGPFNKHEFVGGNAYMVNLLKNNADDIGVTASGEHFYDTLTRIVDQIGHRTAEVLIVNAGLDGSNLIAEVSIASQVGHKFPAGFPSRRAWLHFVVQDAVGEVVFESGALNLDGSIAGNANDEVPGDYERHYSLIEAADQVQIYEAIFVNTDGEVTTTLLRGNSYLKDNRLLPDGFDKSSASEDISVKGEATNDADFQGGSDLVEYRVDLEGAPGPYTITVELLYQSIGYRWLENLRGYDADEVNQMMGFYDASPNLPLLVSSTVATVGE
jgi:hypothetical protein